MKVNQSCKVANQRNCRLGYCIQTQSHQKTGCFGAVFLTVLVKCVCCRHIYIFQSLSMYFVRCIPHDANNSHPKLCTLTHIHNYLQVGTHNSRELQSGISTLCYPLFPLYNCLPKLTLLRHGTFISSCRIMYEDVIF